MTALRITSREIIHTMLPEFGVRMRIVFQENAGISAARNAGINIAKGRYIGLIDSDDRWLPETLERLVGYLDANPGDAMVYANTEYFDNRTGEIVGRNFDAASDKKPYIGRCVDKLFIFENFIPIMTCLIRREAVDLVGLFDTKLKVGEDYDFCLRVASQFSVGYVDKVLCQVRRHGDNLTFKLLPHAWAQIRITRKVLKLVPSLKENIGEEVITARWYRIYYRLGMALVLEGQGKRGRAFLKKSWKFRKSLWKDKWAIYLALSYLPSIRWFKKLRDLWHVLRKKIVDR